MSLAASVVAARERKVLVAHGKVSATKRNTNHGKKTKGKEFMRTQDLGISLVQEKRRPRFYHGHNGGPALNAACA